ncbi:Bacterial regulatory protein, tetR family [Hartmannibacter diazotrophicus]|uniref:Bacterial regulatory protein, tetR family n=1 Tax=Hartmannibacter diazotrophicus TaxID=1482074 RepID=A0A2C9D7V6_9HYPH|nr:TetR/AcrR family transcriptional regulator [Hartmannibacter diazotrophicus]SON56397.1 Bacterial regulatory protein, tetR family [Hartmannibacter diazotrophicus]
MTSHSPIDASELTPRQRDVLSAALDLLVEGGEKGLTTAGLARAAGCSKESLYKWFGDRDGLLAAMVAYQASKVRTPAPAEAMPDEASFRRALAVFAEDLLTVLSGKVSIALNRLAIGQASGEGARLGHILMERGRRTIETRARALIELGRRLGHLEFDDVSEAYEALYGLVVGDSHVQLLLGAPVEDAAALKRRSEAAVDKFFRLYGAGRP